MEIPVKKNEKYVVNILDNGCEGEGIARIDGYTIFVPNTIKNEKCEILILKTKSSYGYGKLLKIIEKSENRQELDCDTYTKCGGCNLRHIQYSETLKLKQSKVQNLVNKNLQSKVLVKSTIGMKTPLYYRNKAQFPVGYNSKNEITTGIYAERTHKIVETKNCMIQNQISQKIANIVLEFLKNNNISAYNEANLKRYN